MDELLEKVRAFLDNAYDGDDFDSQLEVMYIDDIESIVARIDGREARHLMGGDDE